MDTLRQEALRAAAADAADDPRTDDRTDDLLLLAAWDDAGTVRAERIITAARPAPWDACYR